MPDFPPKKHSEDILGFMVEVCAITFMVAYVAYCSVLFIAGMTGLMRQLVNPSAVYAINTTLYAAMWPAFFTLSYVFLPELSRFMERILISMAISVVPMLALITTLMVTLPPLSQYRLPEFTIALFLIFLGFGIMPCLLCARLVAFFHPSLRVGRQGDHYIDIGALEDDIRRIVSKHTGGTFRRPPGWPSSFFGDGGRLTHRDVLRMIKSETEEIRAATTATTEQAHTIEVVVGTKKAAPEPANGAPTLVERVLDFVGVTPLQELRAREAELREELQRRTASLGRAVSEQADLKTRVAEYERQLALLSKAVTEREGVEAALRERISQLEGALARRSWLQPAGGSHAF